MKSKSKIKLGSKDLLPPVIYPKDERVRISIIMEGDLLDLLRAKSAEAGTPYQTFMKEVLRKALMDNKPTSAGLGLEQALKKLNELEEKMEAKFGRVEGEIEDLKKHA